MSQKAKITKRVVDAMRPPAADTSPTILWDSDVPGFNVRCWPSGVKAYGFKYRAGGKQRWRSIGRHGDRMSDGERTWTPENARLEAMRLRGLVAGGKDPDQVDARSVRGDITVSDLAELYLKEGVATKKPLTVKYDRGRIDGHIIPLLGRHRARLVTRADVEQFLAAVAAGKTAGARSTGKLRGKAIVKGGKGAATRAMGLLGSIFSFAVSRGLRNDNPVHGVKRFKDGKRNRAPSSAEFAAVGRALVEAEAADISEYGIAGIRLLALTGARRNEIVDAKWSEVDFENSCLRKADSKTGAKIIPLGAAALEVLSQLPRVEGNAHILPASGGKGHIQSINKVWADVRKRAKITDMRLHDLRHGFASAGVTGGDSLYIVGKILGHRDPSTTQQYSHLRDDPVKAAADRIARHISAAMKGKTAEIKVLPKKRA